MPKKVPCDKAGMTINKFTLKPRGIYVGVLIMGMSFFSWIVWLIIQQNELDMIYFLFMIIGVGISFIIFIDLLTDRFSVEGTGVRRRRGI